jgi:hypothetical protein
MALLASLREVCRNMVRISCAPEILQVAGYARSAGKVVVIVDVAVGALAWRHGVPPGQWKTSRGMIELRAHPVIRAVTVLAGDREFGCDVIGTACALVIYRMARVTVCRHRLELAIGHTFVARVAIDGRMCPGERKAIVVLLHLLDRNRPPPHRVALLAVGTELAFVNIGVAVLATLPHIREDRFHVTLAAGH